MQTKKRAKSVNFGKSHAKKPEKDTVKVIEGSQQLETSVTPSEGTAQPLPSQSNPLHDSVVVETPSPVESKQNDLLSSSPSVSADQIQAASPINPQLSQTPVMAAPLAVPPQPAQPSENQLEEKPQFQTVQPLIQTTADTNEKPDEALISEQSGGGRKNLLRYFLLVMLMAFLVGLAFFAGVYYATQNKNNPLMSFQLNFFKHTAPTPTVVAKQIPTLTPQTSASKPPDLTVYTIQVFNGSGTSGEAAKVKDMLTSAGFKVGDIGNADRSDYTKTQLFAKKTVDPNYLAALKKELEKTYVVEVESSIPSAASGNADVIVTIGSTQAK